MDRDPTREAPAWSMSAEDFVAAKPICTTMLTLPTSPKLHSTLPSHHTRVDDHSSTVSGSTSTFLGVPTSIYNGSRRSEPSVSGHDRAEATHNKSQVDPSSRNDAQVETSLLLPAPTIPIDYLILRTPTPDPWSITTSQPPDVPALPVDLTPRDPAPSPEESTLPKLRKAKKTWRCEFRGCLRFKPFRSAGDLLRHEASVHKRIDPERTVYVCDGFLS